MQRAFNKEIKRVVLKIGSSVITDKKGRLDHQRLKDIVREVCRLGGKGLDLVLVTSGAIASGMELLRVRCRPQILSCLQATAALGQNILMRVYFDAFKRQNRLCAQVLLTWDDFNDRNRYLNAKNTLLKLLEYKVVPVINENDTVAVDEIKFGDNDRLSALVASILDADLLVIFSDVDGLYLSDGTSKKIISEVTNIDDKVAEVAKDTLRRHTSVGGMKTKLEAAKIAMDSGIPCIIANGRTKEVLTRIISGEPIGTIFIQQRSSLLARKRWLAFSTKPKGRIYVDDGAQEALVNKGKSLLSPGIINVEGKFNANDVIAILDKAGLEFAKGISEYSSAELQKIKGTRTHNEVIHRDNLVLLIGKGHGYKERNY